MINLSKIDWVKTLLFLVVLFLISQLYVKCENEKHAMATIDSMNSKMTTYKLSNDKLVFSKNTLELSNDQLKNELEKNKTSSLISKKFANVKEYTTVTEKVNVPVIKVVYKDSIKVKFDKFGEINVPEYSLKYHSSNKGLQINNLSINDTVTIISGMKRKWFLGKETNTIDVSHSNKFIEITEVKHIEKKQPKQFYETNIFKIGIGVLIGVGLHSL